MSDNNGWTWDEHDWYELDKPKGVCHGEMKRKAVKITVSSKSVDEVNTLRAQIANMSAVREERDRLKAEHAEMREVLEGVLSVRLRNGHETEDFDDIACRFRKETGIWPPGKDAPVGIHVGDREANTKAYEEWIESHYNRARDLLARTTDTKGDDE